MAAITRWVLAHKRLVALFWVVLTVVGIATANSATKAMDQKFSVPGKEGWETNVAITEHFHGTGGDTAPIVPGGHAPAGQDRRLARRRSQLTQVDSELEQALPGARIAVLRVDRATAPSSPATGARRSRSSIRSPIPTAFGENPDAAKHARAALQRHDGRRRARARERLRRASERVGRRQRHRACCSRRVLGGVGALIVLAFVFASFLALRARSRWRSSRS